MTSTIADWNGKDIGLRRPLRMEGTHNHADVNQPTGRPPVSRPEAREAHLADMRRRAAMRELGADDFCEAPADWRGEALIRVGKSDANIGRAITVGQHQKGIARAGVSSEFRGGGA